MNLSKKKVQNGWIVFNKDNGTHAHIRYKRTCNDLMCLLRKHIMPKSPYLKESARRLLSDEEYKNLKNKRSKDMYININKGVRA